MYLTKQNKERIDALSYEALLARWRNSPSGDPWFEGETGEYWGERMAELRSAEGGQECHVAASKSVGWQ